MAIPLTWRNLFALVGLAVLVLGAFAGAVSTIVQWQLSSLDNRLNDRLALYHRDIDRIESRLEALEHRP